MEWQGWRTKQKYTNTKVLFALELRVIKQTTEALLDIKNAFPRRVTEFTIHILIRCRFTVSLSPSFSGLLINQIQSEDWLGILHVCLCGFSGVEGVPKINDKGETDYYYYRWNWMADSFISIQFIIGIRCYLSTLYVWAKSEDKCLWLW